MNDEALLENNGWQVECFSPFEIYHGESNSRATNLAANMVLDTLRLEMRDALILQSQSGDWEGFFWNGELIDEAHTLGEGKSRTYLLEMSEKYGFSMSDLRIKEVNDEDENYLCDCGNFPNKLTDLNGEY